MQCASTEKVRFGSSEDVGNFFLLKRQLIIHYWDKTKQFTNFQNIFIFLGNEQTTEVQKPWQNKG